MLDDTHPDVQRRIDAIWAEMRPADRFAAMAEMTEFVIAQSRAAIAATMPGASERTSTCAGRSCTTARS